MLWPARSLLNDQDWFQQLWEERDKVSNKETLFIWGMKDPVIPVTYLKKFSGGFPNNHQVELKTAGHFPQEEQAERVSDELMKWLNKKQ